MAEKEKDKPDEIAPTMADLRLWLDLAISPGEFFTSQQACQGVGAYNRTQKTRVYVGLSRLTQEKLIKKDKYKHGGFIRPLQIGAYDLSGKIETNVLMGIQAPLDLHNIMRFEASQLVVAAGRYDAGKSALLWHIGYLNYRYHKVILFSSPEWDLNMIKKRIDQLEIPRPHPNLLCYPMLEGYEDLIPQEPCVILVDYIRTNKDPFEIDRQLYRILQNLHGGICFAAIQKHPGIDRPTGGQFAVHAPHHVILLDKLKENNKYICKVFKSKSDKDLEGLFRIFKFDEKRKLTPVMDTWKKGEIKWAKDDDNEDNKAFNDNEKGPKSC